MNQLRSTDLKEEIELSTKFGVSIVSDLRISPFASFYLAKGAFSGDTAYNLMFGVSLDYSKLFKLKY